MGHETATNETANPQADAPAPVAKPRGRGVAAAEAAVARGAKPDEVAKLLAQFPDARDEILTYLQQTVGNGYVQHLFAEPIMRADSGPDPKVPMQTLTVKVKGQWVRVYVSAGGVNEKPDVFMFFHGQHANLGIDPKLDKKHDNVSGNDVAGAAMAEAKARNTLAILPQGVDGVEGGGRMDGIVNSDLPTFLDAVLAAIAGSVGQKQLAPNRISIAGHSAGGYMGVHEALSSAGKYNDKITDLTLQDTSYSDAHFADAAKWMVSGPDNKSLRIIQGHNQMIDKVPVMKDDPDHKGKKIKVGEDPPHWARYFTEDKLDGAAKAAGMTTSKLISPAKGDLDGSSTPKNERGKGNNVVQHTQLLKNGKMHCDILLISSALSHHEIRDSTLDDAIDSIGEGAAGSDRFGRNEIPTYGRNKDARHYGNGEAPYNAQDRKEQEEARKEREREKKAREDAAKQKPVAN